MVRNQNANYYHISWDFPVIKNYMHIALQDIFKHVNAFIHLEEHLQKHSLRVEKKNMFIQINMVAA